jgi:Atypical PilZ domain, cyclic di-GMP receptor
MDVGVDTVILNNELAYQDLLPLAFKSLARPLDLASVAALTDRNVRMLQVCAVLEEHGAVEKKDDSSPHAADMLRLEVKVNLMLDLMGQLLAAQLPRPAPTLVRFNAVGAQWNAPATAPPRVGQQGVLEIWLRDSLPQPLALLANITHVAPDGHVKASLVPPGEATADLLEKLAFRRHRRQVAGVRQPRRAGSETGITRIL